MFGAGLHACEVVRETFLDLVLELFNVDLAVDDRARVIGIGNQAGGFAAQFDQAYGNGIGHGDTRQRAALDGLALLADGLHLQQAERAQCDHQHRADAKADHEPWGDSEAAQQRRCGSPT